MQKYELVSKQSGKNDKKHKETTLGDDSKNKEANSHLGS